MYTVTLSSEPAPSYSVAVDLAESGTATAGADFTGGASNLVFNAAETTKTFNVTPLSDPIVEGDETVIYTVVAGTGYTVGAPSSATGTIANDDVAITIAPGTLPGGTVGAAYSQTITGSGGTAPYSFQVTAGSLPNGLTLATGGALSGTPTAAGSFNFTVTATDGSGAPGPYTTTQAYNVTIAAPTLTMTPGAGTLTAAYNTAYSQAFTASGGTGSYSDAITGTLPAGVSLTGSALSGTPTQAGSFNVTVTATDANGQTGSSAYTLNVAAPTLAITPASGALPITYATPFNRSFAAPGGIGPYTYARSGTLPAGLSFTAATATVSGTPTTSGNFAFTITATDTGSSGKGAPFTVAGNYTLAIAAPTITVTPSPLPNATAGTAYSTTLVGGSTVAPYSFALTGGTLPAGVILSASGLLSGTPTASGIFPITV